MGFSEVLGYSQTLGSPFHVLMLAFDWALLWCYQGPCSFMEADQGPVSTEVCSFDVMGSLTHPTQS